ncbi:hypothetical protein D3C84_876230 [compost metagenome]
MLDVSILRTRKPVSRPHPVAPSVWRTAAPARRVRSFDISEMNGLRPTCLQNWKASFASLLSWPIGSGNCTLMKRRLPPSRRLISIVACARVDDPANKSRQMSLGPVMNEMRRSTKRTGLGFEKTFFPSGNSVFKSYGPDLPSKSKTLESLSSNSHA